jgi:hypothetical protein
MIRTITVCLLLASLAITSIALHAEGKEQHAEALVLPADLLALLQAEMREITVGVQVIPVALAQGDWETLEKTGKSIQTSYIMAKALTGEQKKILKSELPTGFKQLDAAFHSRAGKLAHAAEARNFELVSYHYSRLIEGCAQCHAVYAKDKFPGFGPAKEQGHQH